MKLRSLILSFCAQVAVAASASELIDSAIVSIQTISLASTPIFPLAEIKYNPSTLSVELISFDAPELEPSAKLVRIGIYDTTTSTWKSSTSTTSVESFAKGYSPTIVLNLDAQGSVIGVTVKSARIDAGQTRDFGPKVTLRRMEKGKGAELNRPVVLSAEGKLEQPEVEKTMLQKYWWVLLGGVMLLMTAGGGE